MMQSLQWMPSPNYWPGRFGVSPKWVILHGTAGFESAQQVAVYFGTTASGVSAHYIIGLAGEIFYCVKETDAAWANGGITGPAGVSGDSVHHDPWWDQCPTWGGQPNPNLVTISIEHVKPHDDNSDQLTDAQKTASFQLVREICARWNIPARQADASGGITGHFSMDPQNKSRCPGPYPWTELWTYLGGNMPLQITDPFASAHFTEVPGSTPLRWHCKDTGFDVIGAILDYYRQIGGAPRLPRTNEVYTVIPGCSVQAFEAGVLIYDPSAKYDNPGFGAVFMMHLDKDTPGLRQLMALAGVNAPAVTSAKISAATTTLEAVAAGIQNALADLKAS